jgi:hypothetical protein
MRDAIYNLGVGALLGCAMTTVILWGGVAGFGFATHGMAEDRPAVVSPLPSASWAQEPVERRCEDDTSCAEGERCVEVRLSSCASCPPGEAIGLCQPSLD